MANRAQSAIEFIILVGLMIFIFLSYTLIFQKNVASRTYEKRVLTVNELALSVQDEIDLASSSITGYERSFEIPQQIINLNYNITLTEGVVYIITEDNKIALSHSIQNVTGQIQKGTNTIKKNETGVFLNY
jgi:hypothetical protein